MDAAISPVRDARRCARPGCADLAVATLAFRYDRQQAWLTTLVADKTPATYDLCGPCADRTAPPRGWELVDERPALDHLAAPVDERDAVRDAIARALRQSGSGGAKAPEAAPAGIEAAGGSPPPTAPASSTPSLEATEATEVPSDVAVLPERSPREASAEPTLAPVAPVVDLPTPASVLGVEESGADASGETAPPASDVPPSASSPAPAPQAAPPAPSLGLDARPALALVQQSAPDTTAPDAPVAPRASEVPATEEAAPRRRRRRRPVEVLLEQPAAPPADGSHRPGRHAPTSHRLAPVVLRPSAAPTVAPVARTPSSSTGLPPGPVHDDTAGTPAAAPASPVESAPAPVGPARATEAGSVVAPRAVDVPLAFDALPDRLVELGSPRDRA